MPKLTRRIGVVVVSRRPVTRWATRGFAPHAILPDVPATAPLTRLGPESDVETWYAGDFGLTLYSGETGHYRDNLTGGRPSIWVAMRPSGPDGVTLVTADPYEGEALVGDPGLTVEALPMPLDLQSFVQGFVAMYHVEQVFTKRKRKPADTNALSRGGKRILDKDETLP